MSEQGQLLPDAPPTPSLSRQFFVAYSYRDYPPDDYRRAYSAIAEEYAVQFVFADEKITNMHILQKIISYIRSSDFSLFDITGWNPNVTLELGIAMSSDEDWYIAYNPDKTDLNEVPSDLRGIDRIQYQSYSQLQEKLAALVEQRYPRRSASIDVYLDQLREEAVDLLRSQPGLTMQELAEVMGSTVQVMQLAIRPLVGQQLTTTGKRKAMRYYVAGTEPPQARRAQDGGAAAGP